jgi:hypothetical protein
VERQAAAMKSNRQPLIVLALAGIGLAGGILVSTFDLSRLPSPARRLSPFPKIVLWAWERPEELRFIDPRTVGVAFLARTIYLKGERVIVRPRLQPLSVPDQTALMAVVRIESDRFDPPVLSPDQRAKVVSATTELTNISGVTALQVDFDAVVSERALYREVLLDVRRQLPDSIALSITALASWCMHDQWLSGIPIDEAVPVLFRMGADHRQVVHHLETGGDFRPPLCRASLGISTDEPLPKLPSGRRVYIFHPQAWSPEAVRKALEELSMTPATPGNNEKQAQINRLTD